MLSLAFTLPVFLLAMVAMSPPVMHWEESGTRLAINSLPWTWIIQLVLTTPVQLGVGGVFYRSAWAGLRHRTGNMALLVALGTTAAYVYSVLSVIMAGVAVPHEMHQGGMGGGNTSATSAAGLYNSSSGYAHGGGSGADHAAMAHIAVPAPPPPSTVSTPSSLPGGTESAAYDGSVYFEASAVIITFIVLGKWLEARAKSRTSDVVRSLLGLAAKTALLVKQEHAAAAEDTGENTGMGSKSQKIKVCVTEYV